MKRVMVMLLMMVATLTLSTAAVAVAQGGTTAQDSEPGSTQGGTTAQDGEPGGTTIDDTATLGFRLQTEGEVPEDATFFGLYGPLGSEFSAVRLTDPDEDGVYTGAVDLEEGRTYAARLVQGTGTQETRFGTFPGEPSSLIKDFCASGCVTLTEDTTLSAYKAFDSPPGEEQPESETITATGVLEDPEVTSYQYGTHEITDSTTDTTYALRSADEVSLERYEGERVIVYGTREPDYPVEGGPELLDVTYVEPAGSQQDSGEVGTGATAETEAAAFAAANVIGGEAGQITFAEARARALEAARESGAEGATAEAVATAAAEAAISDAEPAPQAEAVAGIAILPDTGGLRAAGLYAPLWAAVVFLVGVGALARRVLRRPSDGRVRATRNSTRIVLALIPVTLVILAVAACGSQDQAEQQSTTPPETTRAETTQQETTQAAGEEAVEVPEDKTLRLTIPKMAQIENDAIPTGRATNENLLRDYAALHLEGTGFPWQEEANVYIAGHRLGYPGTPSYLAFYDLNELQNGDRVTLEDANGKRYEYEVFDQLVVEPKDVYVLRPQEGKNIVSLQTCTLPDYSKRLVVQAELVA